MRFSLVRILRWLLKNSSCCLLNFRRTSRPSIALCPRHVLLSTGKAHSRRSALLYPPPRSPRSPCPPTPTACWPTIKTSTFDCHFYPTPRALRRSLPPSSTSDIFKTSAVTLGAPIPPAFAFHQGDFPELPPTSARSAQVRA